MQYTYKDSRPCYLTAEEKDKHRYDINMGEKQSRYKNTLQLKETLKTAGILDPKGIITQLWNKCKELNLPLKLQEDKIIEGWVNKPKGSLQVLFEYGWINPDCIKLYITKYGQKDLNGTAWNQSDAVHPTVPEDPTGCNYSIAELMKLQTDFMTELTLQQFHVLKLGIQLDCTPRNCRGGHWIYMGIS